MATEPDAVFARAFAFWGLVADGAPIVTRGGRLRPVLYCGAPAMLKIALVEEEKSGAAVMAWWEGDGAARVLTREGDAVLLERAMGGRSLAAMARSGADVAATRIICAAVARLHLPRSAPPALVPLARWFRDLDPAAATHGGILAQAARAARGLLASPRDIGPLHGDIHHGNILDFGARGWLAIDPKGLSGERAFDYANLFRNPDATTAVAHFATRLGIVASAAETDRRRLLEWILAWAGLSAAWDLADGIAPEASLAIAERAAAELAR